MESSAETLLAAPAPAKAVQSFVSDRALQARWNFYQPEKTVSSVKAQGSGPGTLGWRKSLKLNDEE